MISNNKAFITLLVCIVIFSHCEFLYECGPVADMSSSHSLRDQEGTQQLERQIEIERVKLRLLNYLHMSGPPNITNQNSLLHIDSLPNYYKNKMRQETQPKEEKSPPEELILKAKPMLSCFPGTVSSCFVIDILDDLPRRSIISAKLFADRESESLIGKHLELWEIRLLGSTVNFIGSPISTAEVSENEEEAISFEFSGKLAHWLRNKERQRQRKISRSLMILCSDCSDEVAIPVNENKTILEIKYIPLHRQKRSTSQNCRNNINIRCCKQELTISFASIGWHNWVAYPPNISPNFCRGRCRDGSHSETSHADLMHLYSYSTNQRLRDEMRPCCAARSLASFTLVYITGSGGMHLKSIPNMIVDSCGCI